MTRGLAVIVEGRVSGVVQRRIIPQIVSVGIPGASGMRAVEEVPAGAVNGTNKNFTIGHAAAVLVIWQNGIKLKGDGNDYTLTGTNIVFVTAPFTGDILTSVYFY